MVLGAGVGANLEMDRSAVLLFNAANCWDKETDGENVDASDGDTDDSPPTGSTSAEGASKSSSSTSSLSSGSLSGLIAVESLQRKKSGMREE